MKIKRTEIQNGLPSELYPVRIYALQPAATPTAATIATES